MKKVIIFLTIVFLFASFSVYVYAHPGKTDSNGGHNDRQNGDYHYHHGYPAHSHIDGVCPYDYDDKTDHSYNSDNSGNSSNDESIKTSQIKFSSIGDLIGKIVTSLLESIAIFFAIGILVIIVCQFFFPKFSDKAFKAVTVIIAIISIILALTTNFVF